MFGTQVEAFLNHWIKGSRIVILLRVKSENWISILLPTPSERNRVGLAYSTLRFVFSPTKTVHQKINFEDQIKNRILELSVAKFEIYRITKVP